MKLYDYILSPDCYTVRLFAALSQTELALRPVDFHPGKEHLGPELLRLNPAGSLPVLEDGDLVLSEPAAMLVYIAEKAAEDWLGRTAPDSAARVQQWLGFSRRLSDNLGGARLCQMLLYPGDVAALQLAGRTALRELEAGLVEQDLGGNGFLAGPNATIADIACFAHVALAPDGNVDLEPYPAIRRWLRAIRSLPGFIEMPGIHRLHELKPDP